MITWAIDHWTWLAGGGGLTTMIPVLIRLPRLAERLAVIADCEWHRAQGLARERALERAINRMENEVEKAIARAGGSDSSESTTTPTTPTRIR